MSAPARVVMPATPPDPPDVARGRRPSTSRREVARAARELFARQGYEETSIDQIAAAVGVSRRTFFRYYDSKRDVVWGEFDAELVRLQTRLAAAPADQPMMDVLRRAVVDTNRFEAGELAELRVLIALTTTVPDLVAHSAVRYADWCQVVAAFVAGRIGAAPGDLVPQTVARAVLGVAMAAFIHWAGANTGDLVGELDDAFRMLAAGFAEDRLPVRADRTIIRSTPPSPRREAGSGAAATPGVARGGPST